jgi:hypothetical protein
MDAILFLVIPDVSVAREEQVPQLGKLLQLTSQVSEESLTWRRVRPASFFFRGDGVVGETSLWISSSSSASNRCSPRPGHRGEGFVSRQRGHWLAPDTGDGWRASSPIALYLAVRPRAGMAQGADTVNPVATLWACRSGS